MVHVITINRPDVVALIETAARRLTGGNTTQAVARAIRRLLERGERIGSLFGAHPEWVRVTEGVDLLAPALDIEPDAGGRRASY